MREKDRERERERERKIRGNDVGIARKWEQQTCRAAEQMLEKIIFRVCAAAGFKKNKKVIVSKRKCKIRIVTKSCVKNLT